MTNSLCGLVSKQAVADSKVKSIYKIKNGGNISVVSLFGKSEYNAALYRAAVAFASKEK